MLARMSPLPPAPPDVGIGARIGGRYRLTREVHAGRASLFEAVDENEGPVSVRIFRRELVSEDALSRFIRAASVMTAANDARVVPVLDIGHDMDRDLVFVVTPRLRGEDLSGVLRRTGPLAPEI